jgi:hypothetical protein
MFIFPVFIADLGRGAAIATNENGIDSDLPQTTIQLYTRCVNNPCIAITVHQISTSLNP